ncbi:MULTISPECIES: potassium channel family protein [unclassified Roseitalea]|uniref:potassium channel family protein n=1 Tax=unclassified Roseitalea TaxID=2639107 RepID=UPI00273ED412|nr:MULTISPECIES: potassium channel family protein [unclassified Roseitalea]
MPGVRIAFVASALMIILASGTVFFRLVEGWSWVDSYFFTVVTLSTVGYGSLVPQTVLGKIATTAFIFVGLGIFAAAIQQIATFATTSQEERRARRRLRRAQRRKARKLIGDDDVAQTEREEA